jgi:hypothetical protein
MPLPLWHSQWKNLTRRFRRELFAAASLLFSPGSGRELEVGKQVVVAFIQLLHHFVCSRVLDIDISIAYLLPDGTRLRIEVALAVLLFAGARIHNFGVVVSEVFLDKAFGEQAVACPRIAA